MALWTKNPAAEKMATIQHYLADPEMRKLAWQNRLTMPAWTAEPNAGHLAIVELERQGKLHALVTQNIDELHQRAGTDPDKVVEVHGTVWWTRCWECRDRRPMRETLDRVRRRRSGSAVPRLRRDHQERHDQLRAGARPRGDRPGDAGQRRMRRTARHRLDARRVSRRPLRADRQVGRRARS